MRSLASPHHAHQDGRVPRNGVVLTRHCYDGAIEYRHPLDSPDRHLAREPGVVTSGATERLGSAQPLGRAMQFYATPCEGRRSKDRPHRTGAAPDERNVRAASSKRPRVRMTGTRSTDPDAMEVHLGRFDTERAA